MGLFFAALDVGFRAALGIATLVLWLLWWIEQPRWGAVRGTVR